MNCYYGITQKFTEMEVRDKRAKLFEILEELGKKAYPRILIFCNSNKGCDFLAVFLLVAKYDTLTIHCDRFESQREGTLTKFQQDSEKMKILIATADIAPVLKIGKVPVIIMYDLPDEIEEYETCLQYIMSGGTVYGFYVAERDRELAFPLAAGMRRGGQNVPKFLDIDVDEERNRLKEQQNQAPSQGQIANNNQAQCTIQNQIQTLIQRQHQNQNQNKNRSQNHGSSRNRRR